MAEPLRCYWDPKCAFDVVFGVSLRGEHYQPMCMEHALFHAVPLTRSVMTVELTPLSHAFTGARNFGS
jgi:hypothetical protein